MYNPLDLSGKLVLITGASSGIGRATALVLSKLGARLILTGRRESALRETASMTLTPDYHMCCPFDLRDLEKIDYWMKSMVDRAAAPLNGVVHAAGVNSRVPLRAISKSNIEAIMIPNCHAALLLVRAATAKGIYMDQEFSIVLISSVAAVIASPGLVTYSASKAALNAISRSAAKELASKRIRLNCISPGYVKTPMLEKAQQSLPDFQHIKRQQFLGMIEPADIGELAAYLLSNSARSITGGEFVIDGGLAL